MSQNISGEIMRWFITVACGVLALSALGCGGGKGAGNSKAPSFTQAETVALEHLPSCPGKRAGKPTIAAPSVDVQRLRIAEEQTLECGGSVILHWFRFADASARGTFAANEVALRGVIQSPFLVAGTVLVRVANARDVPAAGRPALPRLASDLKVACGCGEVVTP